MNFCPDCGSKVALQTVSGDDRQRFVCPGCETTHYQNPNVLVAVYVCVGNQVLWIRRGISPAIGKWAMPGGFMENNETPESAASRELREETGLDIPPEKMMLVSVSSILNMAQTHLVFRCHLDVKPTPVATEEAIECAWFGQDELPWRGLAFPGIEPLVRQVYRWLESGNYGIRVGFIDENGSQYRVYPLSPLANDCEPAAP
ncbi:MAG: NUDIX hydrolase [Woeseiaceae bacterium]|nr:NUDIX hydrolase [Woeseiaceae bacterium]